VLFFGIDVDEAVVIFDDAVNGGQAQPGAPAHFFGGEKRLKNPFPGFLIHSDAVVGDGYPDKAAPFAAVVLEVIFVHDLVLRFEMQIPAGGHGLRGIDKQIHQNLFDLLRIDFRGPQRIFEMMMNLDFLFGSADGLGRLTDQVIEVHAFDFMLAAAGKAEQLLGEPRAADDQLFDRADVFAIGIAGAKIQKRKRGMALNAHEQIVEIMRDASRQRADGFHFLRLQKPHLRLFLPCNVAHEVQRRRSVFPPHHDAVGGHPDGRFVLANHPEMIV